MDVTELNTKLLKPWDYVKAPATMFPWGDKYERQLEKLEINAQPALQLAIALSVLKALGKYNTPIGEWNARATNDKKFDNFCPLI